MTVEEVIRETRNWSPEKLGELVIQLTDDLHSSAPEMEAAWKAEIDRRIREIEKGIAQTIPLNESLDRIRKLAGA